jgi:outer membrane protein with beta-barrel domain
MKTNVTLALGCVLAASTLAFGEENNFHRSNITVGVGPAIPVGNTTNYLNTAPFVTVGYGYRFNRWFQADAGFQAAFGAASNQNAEQTDLGPVQGGDHEFMIPLGGRIYIPQPFKRFEVSAGGGAAYLHYSETVPSNGAGYSLGCYSCTSRGGWGGYGLATVSYFLDANHNFRVGTTFQLISASTNGQAVGNVPAISTVDHWTNLSFEFGLSF